MRSTRRETSSAISRTSSVASLIIAGLLGLASAADAQGAQQHKLLPDDGAAGDLFGASVATDGAIAVVGAPNADHAGANSGAAYVFGVASGAQRFALVPSNGAAGDQLGASIAVDGARVAVGAPLADRAGADSGVVYVFDAATGAELLELTPAGGVAGDQFGFAVAMDGGVVAVGGLGVAYLFDAATGQELEQLLPTGGSTTLGLSGFGEAIAIDAGRVVVGARLENGVSGIAGAAYVFDAANGDQLHRLVANNGTAWSFFGACVSIDGDVVGIGAPEAYGGVGKHAGVAYVFDASSGQQIHYLWPSPSPNGGHVFAKFGSSVAVDGQDVFIGSEQNNVLPVSSAGSVYHYDAQSGGQVMRMVAGDPGSGDDFGGAVAAAGGVLVSGAPRDDDQGSDSGSAYVFGAPFTCQVDLGFHGPGEAIVTLCGDGLNEGQVSSYDIAGAPSSAPGVLFVSQPGFGHVAVSGGTLVSFGGFAAQVPIASLPGGNLSLVVPGLAIPFEVVLQSVFLDLSLPRGVAFTNAILAEFGP